MLLTIDIATAPIDRVAEFLEPATAPSNYRDEAKIAAYIAEQGRKDAELAALDPDLGRIIGIGMGIDDGPAITFLAKTEQEEKEHLATLAEMLESREPRTLIGFNSLRFDWPYLMRRGQYLGVPITINIDKYRTPHIDLSARLSHNGTLTTRSLRFYAKRLGFDGVKTLTGAEEAQVPETGKWDELVQSLEHDVNITRKLAKWMGVYEVMR